VARSSSTPALEAHTGAYRVEGPRASDAVAAALRDAYEEEMDLPDDMIVLLHRLNGAPHTTH
jgi:hypothetical protein